MKKGQDQINFTRAKLEQLRAAHKAAVERGDVQFSVTFEPEGECHYATTYAGYVVEYLDAILV